jgi:D-amino-acid dehydrogenase
MFPPLGPVRRAVVNRAAGRVDGRRMAAALLHGARVHGVVVLEATATGLRIDGGQVVGVDTSAGAVSCGAVAIAGGAWSPTFGRQLGVTIPVAPVKGQIVHLQLPPTVGDSGTWPIVSPVFTHYLVAWPGGRVACGGTYEADAGFDCSPTAAGLSELLTACLSLAPGLAGASVAEVRVGLRPVAVDDVPVLGPVPGWDNVHVATGHGTEGLLLGPHSAALVARGLTGPVPDELAPYSVARFGG